MSDGRSAVFVSVKTGVVTVRAFVVEFGDRALDAHDHVPPAVTVAVHSVVPPSVTVTVSPAMPVPVMVGVVLLVKDPFAGAVMTGGAGGATVKLYQTEPTCHPCET